MSEQIIPDVELASDVVVAEAGDKTLAELIKLFEELLQNL